MRVCTRVIAIRRRQIQEMLRGEIDRPWHHYGWGWGDESEGCRMTPRLECGGDLYSNRKVRQKKRLGSKK